MNAQSTALFPAGITPSMLLTDEVKSYTAAYLLARRCKSGLVCQSCGLLYEWPE
jgi:hypothetical protein